MIIRTAAQWFLFAVLLASPVGAGDLKQELWSAAKKGDAKVVESLLARGADVNAKTAYGVTALLHAAGKGHVEVVRILLKHKADVNAADSFYRTNPLSEAAEGNHVEVVKLLLDAGAKGADKLLSGAIKAKRLDLVRALLEKGHIKPESLTTAMETLSSDQKELAEMLKKAGAKPPADAFRVDPETLKSYVGPYENQGNEFTIALKNEKLSLQFSKQDLYSLRALDATRFKAAGEEITITFQREGSKVTGFSMKSSVATTTFRRIESGKVAATKPAPTPVTDDAPGAAISAANWPSFRGPHACGHADGQYPPMTWDAPKGTNVRWKTPIPGLGHSCPIVWGDRVFVTTAVSGDPKSTFRPGLYGNVDSVNDTTVHTWRVYCMDKQSGKVLWERVAHEGVPKIKRHTKGSHANCTPVTDGNHLVVCFGSEGLYCYDFQGKLLWKRDIGVLDSGFFFDADYQWGFGSSPILFHNLVILQCDVGKNSFIAAYDVASGREVWLSPRDEIPSWGTPTICEGHGSPELVTNATKHARGYDPLTGKELWRLGRHAEITVPTPVAGSGLIFITSGYRPIQPIYAIRPGAKGDISLKEGQESDYYVAWSKKRGGPYMPTPIVYRDYLYTCSNNGIVTCYEATTGKQIYQERLGGSGGYTASPVAADGKLYFTSEEAGIRVVKAGPRFELLATNSMGDVCMATPAISDGMLFIRSQHFVYGIGRQSVPKAQAPKPPTPAKVAG
jgi:outer membrane protein assembly factor BamB